MPSAGDDLICIAVADAKAAQELAARLRRDTDWLETVAGIDSVVVQFDLAALTRRDAEIRIRELLRLSNDASAAARRVVEISIHYGGDDGPDFAAVCTQLGLSRDQFIELHCGEYTVDMLGFTPGFAYVGGLPENLAVARLSAPRTRVAAGSVGIADRCTGLYALPGPGGWPIIGRTDAQLFNAASEDPFTLGPGMVVRFVAIESQ